MAKSVECLLRMQAVPRSTLASGTFFRGDFFPSSADSGRASSELLAKDWALNAGKLPSKGLTRNSVVKYV